MRCLRLTNSTEQPAPPGYLGLAVEPIQVELLCRQPLCLLRC